MHKILFVLLIFLLFTACYQRTNDDDLNTNPITNNPNITPHNSSILPNM